MKFCGAMTYYFIFALLAFTLTGCSLSSEKQEIPLEEHGPLELWLASASQGDETIIDDPSFGKQVRVCAGEEFKSASGQHCRQGTVVAGQTDMEMVVVCRGTDGIWRMAPRVWATGVKP